MGMPTFKERLDADIRESLAARHADEQIARKIFLSPVVLALDANPGLRFSILDDVRKKFDVPFTHIHVTGSAKTGYSYFKDREFIAKESDLDIAIIDERLFIKFHELAAFISSNFRDQTKFKRTEEAPDPVASFLYNLSIGFIRPDLLPTCSEKSNFLDYFNALTDKHSDTFKSISGAIYLSERFFERKQRSTIQKFKEKNQ